MVRVADCIADELMDQHWRIKGVRAKNAHAVSWGKIWPNIGWRPPGVGAIPPLYMGNPGSATDQCNQPDNFNGGSKGGSSHASNKNFRNPKLKNIIGASSLGWCLLLRETLNLSLNLYGNLPSGNSSLFSVLEFKTWESSFLKNFSHACRSSIFVTSM